MRLAQREVPHRPGVPRANGPRKAAASKRHEIVDRPPELAGDANHISRPDLRRQAEPTLQDPLERERLRRAREPPRDGANSRGSTAEPEALHEPEAPRSAVRKAQYTFRRRVESPGCGTPSVRAGGEGINQQVSSPSRPQPTPRNCSVRQRRVDSSRAPRRSTIDSAAVIASTAVTRARTSPDRAGVPEQHRLDQAATHRRQHESIGGPGADYANGIQSTRRTSLSSLRSPCARRNHARSARPNRRESRRPLPCPDERHAARP